MWSKQILKILFGKANDSNMKVIVSITSGVSFWDRPYY